MNQVTEEQSEMTSSETEVNANLSYEDLEVKWMDVVGDDDDEDEEWVPVVDDRDDSGEVLEEDECVRLDEEELNTIVDESKIAKVLDDYNLDDTVFRVGELE